MVPEPMHVNLPGEMQSLLHDVFPMHNIQEDEGESQMGVEARVGHQDEEAPTEDAQKFFKLLKDSEEPLWSGCTDHSIFSAILGLFNLKCEGGWSNASFTKLLDGVTWYRRSRTTERAPPPPPLPCYKKGDVIIIGMNNICSSIFLAYCFTYILHIITI
jgi:hypothetical protein